MPVYRAGFASAAPANGAPYATLNCPTRKGNVHSVDYSLQTAVQSQIGYGTPANEATPPVVSTSITPVGKPSDIAATARIGTAWSTAPTVPGVMVDERIIAGVVGAGWTIQWSGLADYDEVKIGGWRTLWNRGGGTAGVFLVVPIFDE